jgi:hypothetical protein
MVYPAGGIKWEIDISNGRLIDDEQTLASLRAKDHTQVLLRLAYGHRYEWATDDRPQVAVFTTEDANLSVGQIGSGSFDPYLGEDGHGRGLIRDAKLCPFLYEGIIPTKPGPESVKRPFLGYELAPSSVPYIALRKWPRHRDFLHPWSTAPGNDTKFYAYSRVLPITWAKIDEIPLRYTYFGMLIPSVLHELEVQLRVQSLAEDLLADLGISNHHLLREATSARSAQEPVDYERIEFLGDSLLKTSTAINMAALRKSISINSKAACAELY